MGRTGNPVLNANTFSGVRSVGGSDSMTINGTVLKTGALLLLVVCGAIFTWNRAMVTGSLGGWGIAGGIGGFAVSILPAFPKGWAPGAGPLYSRPRGALLWGGLAFF